MKPPFTPTDIPIVPEILAYYEKYADRLPVHTVVERAKEEWSDVRTDPDRRTWFWVGLAMAGMQRGYLLAEVKRPTLHFLSTDAADSTVSPEDFGYFESYRSWKRDFTDKLSHFKNIVPKKSTRCHETFHCGWKIGDVYARYHEDSGKWVLFRMIGECGFSKTTRLPVVYLSVTKGAKTPTADEIAKADYLPIRKEDKGVLIYKGILCDTDPMEYRDQRFVYCGNFAHLPPPEDEWMGDPIGLKTEMLMYPRIWLYRKLEDRISQLMMAAEDGSNPKKSDVSAILRQPGQQI